MLGTRSRVLSVRLLVGLCLGLAASLLPPPATAGAASVEISWVRRASGLSSPVQVANAKDGTGRLFLVEKAGRIRIYRAGRMLAKPYLDIRNLVDDAGERGLLSVAFSPRWRTSPYLWVSYTNARGTLRIVRFKAKSYTANSIDRSTARLVFEVPHPANYTNHNAGQLVFGRDRTLFIATGDGGGGGDPGNRAQSLRSLSGKILRLDVLRGCGSKRYCIPSTNPWAKSKVYRRAIWARGVRNPWRMSIDAATGDLWVADVGQNRYEEITRLSTKRGGHNLGWSCREARAVYISSRCGARGGFVGPTFAYPRSYGQSVTGGFVYRGSRYASLLRGRYIGADYVSGRVFIGSGRSVSTVGRLSNVTSFGEGGDRELWAVTAGGALYAMRARRS
jgi:glucose/arabinose dehydrogenase